MHLIVGLGNPGGEYAHQRHNVGFMAVDAIAAAHGFPPFRKKFSGQFSEGTIGDARVMLLKPQTFVNRSGDSVGAAAKFYKLGPADISVIVDELDLTPGKVRVKTGGSQTHNGLRSISPVIGPDYQRVRIGIGHPGHKELVQRHVLGDFAKLDAEWLDPLLEAIGANAGLLVAHDEAKFMNKLAVALNIADEKVEKAENAAKLKAQSHIRQARPAKPATKVPETGPMAAMLRRLFKKDSE